jgi:hypothetical protein
MRHPHAAQTSVSEVFFERLGKENQPGEIEGATKYQANRAPTSIR